MVMRSDIGTASKSTWHSSNDEDLLARHWSIIGRDVRDPAGPEVRH